jgi:hypothetical protein
MDIDLVVSSSCLESVLCLLNCFRTLINTTSIPLWAINFKFFGKIETNSSSIRPVIATLWKVRYAATTLSKAPDLHSLMNSSRERALGSIASAISEIAAHSLCALKISSTIQQGWRSRTNADKENYGRAAGREHTGRFLPKGEPVASSL